MMAYRRSTFSAPLRCASLPAPARRRAVSRVTAALGRGGDVKQEKKNNDVHRDGGHANGCSGDDPMLHRVRRGVTAAAAAAAVALSNVGGPMLNPPSAEAITSNNLLFLEAWRAVDKAYVDKTFNGVTWFKYREDTVKKTPMDSTDETYDAIRAMLAKLDDPFTRFLEPEKYASLSESTMSANITGVGIEMAYDGGASPGSAGAAAVVVVAPTPGGPAEQAGVRPADAIVEVDGRSTDGLSLYEVAEALQGPAGSKVELTLAREGSNAPTKVGAVNKKRPKV